MTDMFRTVDAQTLDNPIEQLIVECRTAERSGRLKVSDVHVTTDGEPYLRIDGELRAHEYPKLTVSDVKEFVDKVGAANQSDLAGAKCFTASYSSPDAGLCRVHVQMSHGGTKIVVRLLHDSVPTFDELKLPEVVRTFAGYANGLVLVTGGTGSGKSTTLAALVDLINTTRNSAIYTVEDPIEYIHESKRSDITQMTIGKDTPSFERAIESMLRMDPDVILVGEIRNAATALACLQGAETGHLVFASLHDNSAADTVTRLINMFPADIQPQIRTSIASSLRAVLSQRLVPRIDGRGRLAVAEVLVSDIAFQQLVRKGEVEKIYALIDAGRSLGMTTMEYSLERHVKDGAISPEVALDYANQRDRLSARIEKVA